VKKPTVALLSTVFVALIACSIQSVTADHHLSGNSIFKDLTHVNIADQKDSEYHIYLQVEVRNAQGQLISISEDSIGRIIPHELTDHIFNENLGKIEIITVDNIKYEKVQYTDYMQAEELLINSQTSHFIGLWRIIMCGEVVGHGHPCLPVFQVNTSHVFITKGDAVTLHWTILRIIN
jgi:hypothetical protein